MRKALLALSLCAAALTAQAAEVSGVKLEDKVNVGGTELLLNGAGIRTKVFVKVYVGALYMPAKQGDGKAVINAATPRRMQLVLMRDVTSKQMIDAINDGFKDNGDAEKLAKQIEQFEGVLTGLKELKKGDQLVFDFVPGTGVKIGFNGSEKGSVAGDDFSKALLRVWLGDKPVQEGLKKALLGAA